MLTESRIRENCFREIFENANLRELCASKIWTPRGTYVVCDEISVHVTPV